MTGAARMISSIVIRCSFANAAAAPYRPGCGMGDQLDRHLVHPPFEPALGDEAVAEARTRQIIREPQAHAAGDHDRRCALRQRHVAGDRAERQAKPVERGGGEAVGAFQRGGPQFLVVVEGQVAAFDRAERFVKVPQPLPRGDPLDRDPPEVPPQLRQDLVLEAVERGEIDMAALGLDHLIMVALLEQRGDAEAGARADDADHALLGKRRSGPQICWKSLVAQRRDGISRPRRNR